MKSKKNKKNISSVLVTSIAVSNIPIGVLANEFEENLITNSVSNIKYLDENNNSNVKITDIAEEGILEDLDSINNESEKILTKQNNKKSKTIISKYSAGDGTELNPYQISTYSDLSQLILDVNAFGVDTTGVHYKLMNDIDLSNFNHDNNGIGMWIPIGYYSSPFKGVFDGNNFTISNLNIEGKNHAGFFSIVDNATIKNLNIENASIINCDGWSGTIVAGALNSVTIENCNSTGNISSSINATGVGGLVGYAKESKLVTIKNSSFIGDIESIDYTGGLLGWGTNILIEDSYAKGNISSVTASTTSRGQSIGGLVGIAEAKYGQTDDKKIINSHFEGTVFGTTNIGGVIGKSSGEITITDSYSKGSITGKGMVSGLIGTGTTVNIENSYYEGDIKATLGGGGLAGWIDCAKINNSYAKSNISLLLEGNVTYSDTGDYAGGLIGNINGYGGVCKSSLLNVKYEGTIISNNHVGGLVGASSADLVIDNAIINANISSQYGIDETDLSGRKSGSYVGGGVGEALKITLSNSSYKGEIIGSTFIGGMVGSAHEMSSSNVEVDTVITTIDKGHSFSGGLVGIINKYTGAPNDFIVENNSVNVILKGGGFSGGLVGKTTNGNITDSIIIANISGNNMVGGLVGYDASDKTNPIEISNTKVKGEVTGNLGVGGFIGWTQYPIINNSNVDATIINDGDYTGGFTGYINNQLELNNSNFKGMITGKVFTGGISGRSKISNIFNVKVLGNITGGGFTSGIIAEQTDALNLDKTYVNSNIIGTYNTAGLIGRLRTKNENPHIIKKSYYNGEINGESNVAGLIGVLESPNINIENSYTVGVINGIDNVGGIIGLTGLDNTDKYGLNLASIDISIQESYTATKLSSDNIVSNIVAFNVPESTISLDRVYYDKEILSDKVAINDGAIGLTTNQMRGEETYDNINLDFINIWKPNKEFYPTFEQLNSAPEIIPNDKVVDSTITINQYDKFNPLDYITTEDFEGDEVTVTVKETLDTSKYGVFSVIFVATDSKGLSSELTLNVKINPVQITINNIPVIVAEDKIVTVGDKFNPLSMIVAYDKEDGIITNNVKIIENTVDINKAGVYKVTYEVIDKDGAKATKTITVTVKEKEVVSNDSSSDNNQNSTTDKDNSNVDSDTATEKPQTSDIGFIGVMTALMSIVGLYILNRKKEK